MPVPLKHTPLPTTMAAARVFLATLLALIASASAGTGGLRAAGSDTAATTRRLSLHEHVARAGSTQFTDTRHLAVNPGALQALALAWVHVLHVCTLLVEHRGHVPAAVFTLCRRPTKFIVATPVRHCRPQMTS